MFIIKFWRETVILGLLALAVFLYNFPQNCPTPEVKIVTKTEEVVVTKVVEKIKEIKPDGTVIEKEITKDEKKDSKVSDKKTDKVVVASKPKYEAAVAIRDLDYKDLVVGVGARLGDSPFWATAGYEVKTKSALIGIKVEF